MTAVAEPCMLPPPEHREVDEALVGLLRALTELAEALTERVENGDLP